MPPDGPRPRRPTLAGLEDLAASLAGARSSSSPAWAGLLDDVAVNLRLGFTSAVLAAAGPGPAEPAAAAEDWRRAGWLLPKGGPPAAWIITGAGTLRRPSRAFTVSQVTWSPAARRRPAPVPLPVQPGGDVTGALAAVARRLGWDVTRTPGAGPVTVNWQARALAVPAEEREGPAGAQLAHLLAHITLDDPPTAAGQADGCFGEPAAIADSVAWLVLRRLAASPADAGITLTAPRDWAGTPAALAAAGQRIADAAARIAAHGEKVLAPLPPYRPRPSPEATVPASPRPQGRPRTAPPAAAPGPRLRALPAPGPARGAPQFPPAFPRLGRPEVPPRPAPEPGILRVNEAAARFFASQLPGSWAGEYLRGDRKLDDEAITRWGLGYAPASWTGLLNHLRREHYGDELAVAAGLAVRTSRGTLVDVFRDRVMIPVRDPAGNLAGFAGRAPPGAPGDVPKYLNTRETAAYAKDRLLFGLHEASRALAAGARPVLVEGYFDVIAVTGAGGGPYAGVAPGGTGLSDAQMSALAIACDLDAVPLLVARDPDPAGRRAAARDYQVILPWCPLRRAAALPADPAGVYEAAAAGHPAGTASAAGWAGLARALAAGEHPLADVVTDAALDKWDRRLRYPADAEAFPGLKSWDAPSRVAAIREAATQLAGAWPQEPGPRQLARIALRTGTPWPLVHWEAHMTILAAGTSARPDWDPLLQPRWGPGPGPEHVEAMAARDPHQVTAGHPPPARLAGAPRARTPRSRQQGSHDPPAARHR